MVLLDHTKTFDTVDRVVLLKKLRKLFNFSNSACNLIYSYLLNRFRKVHLNVNISDPINISKGVPQGSLLRNLLFYMYINDLPDVLVHCNVHMHANVVQRYTNTPKENIDSCLDYINRDLVRIDN